jgi:glycosyltransferase involved in cell wall biosynthesis
MTTYQIGFVLEQALGHITHTKNLQQNVLADPEVRPHWGLIPFEADGIARHIPIYKSNWTVRAGIRARRAVANLARRQKLDMLFFHTQVPAVLASDWVRRIPSIVSLDATPLQYDSLGQVYAHESGPAWMESLKWRLNRDCFRAARHLVAWSHWTLQGLVDGYEVPAEKITVIPPGVNVKAWARATPRQRSSDPVRVLFVGGDFERKGGQLLLEAFRAVRSLGVELHVVTKAALPSEPGLFVYTGMRPNSDELKALYHRSDIFCLPTYGDCLPMVLSEAGAAGLPSISTRVAGIPEIVRDGETGALIPVGDTAALTEALRALVLNPELRLQQGERAVAAVTRDFDAERNTLRLLKLLKQMS